MPVETALPFHGIVRGSPTLTEMTFIGRGLLHHLGLPADVAARLAGRRHGSPFRKHHTMVHLPAIPGPSNHPWPTATQAATAASYGTFETSGDVRFRHRVGRNPAARFHRCYAALHRNRRRAPMLKITLSAFIAVLLAFGLNTTVWAQSRVFVAAQGSDSN